MLDRDCHHGRYLIPRVTDRGGFGGVENHAIGHAGEERCDAVACCFTKNYLSSSRWSFVCSYFGEGRMELSKVEFVL